jgi:cytochrome c biogenesis protein CcmG/thiol:disulfide interchange protein DsbE
MSGPLRSRRTRYRCRRPGLLPVAGLLVAGLLGVGVVAGPGVGRPSATPTRRLPVPAPALVGTTLSGDRFDLAEARGQVVLVNVFASWCGPCRDELPLLIEAGRRWSPHGLRLVGLNLRDGAQAVQALLDATGADGFTVLPDHDGTRAIEWGVRGVPETFVVDRDGRIVAYQSGVVTRAWLEAHLTALFETP